jgi:hypothetical protein
VTQTLGVNVGDLFIGSSLFDLLLLGSFDAAKEGKA